MKQLTVRLDDEAADAISAISLDQRRSANFVMAVLIQRQLIAMGKLSGPLHTADILALEKGS